MNKNLQGLTVSWEKKQRDTKVSTQPNQIIAICSFSGKAADFYVGLTENPPESSIRIVGAVCSEFVETAINNILGQGITKALWPVILGLDEKLIFHSYEANEKGLSPILGWKKYLSDSLAVH